MSQTGGDEGDVLSPAVGVLPEGPPLEAPIGQQRKHQIARIRKALLHYFVNPSKRYAMCSSVDPSIQMEGLDILCPDVTERVADLYLRCTLASTQFPPEGNDTCQRDQNDVDGEPGPKKSLRLPMLAFLTQRWVYNSAKVWIPGCKFDEWCRRRNREDTKVFPILSPYFLDCEIWLTNLPVTEDEFRQLIHPFPKESAKTIAQRVLKEERAMLTLHNLQHFLVGCWQKVLAELTVSGIVTESFREDPVAPIRTALKSARQQLERLFSVVETPLFSERVGDKSVAFQIYASHRDVIFSASPFDLAGSACFLALKEICEASLRSGKLSEVEEKRTVNLMSAFHSDCLLYFNYKRCKPNRITQELDGMTYFIAMQRLQSRSDPPRKRTRCRSNSQHSKQTSVVSFSPIRYEDAATIEEEPVRFGSCFYSCMRDQNVLDKFRACTTDGGKTLSAELHDGDWTNSTREHFRSSCAFGETEDVILPSASEDCLDAFLRTAEEERVYAAAREKLYPAEVSFS